MRLRTWQRAVCAAASVVAVLGAGASLAATPAEAAPSSWWQLSSSARPAQIEPGTAKDETEMLTVTATSGTYTLRAPNSGAQGAPDEGQVENVNFVKLPFNANAVQVQGALAQMVGAGNVAVAEESSSPREFLIAFQGARSDQPVQLLAEGKATLTELSMGRPDGEVFLTAENLGDSPIQAEANPVTITDALPPGLRAVSVNASSPNGITQRSPFPCAEPPAQPSCSFGGSTGPHVLAPYDLLEMRIGVVAEPGAHTGEDNRVIVSGGGTPAASLTRPVAFGSAPPPFGLADFRMAFEEEGGAADIQAGSHPFQFTTTVVINEGPPQRFPEVLNRREVQKANGEPAGLAKDVYTKLPVGLIGNPNAYP
ncbi:MAG TPA: hypothetical protein VGO13_09540, partial [Solirubrobacterales bacterium]|nr:hypothetical protein [Solirubrobacterales bacterium]